MYTSPKVTKGIFSTKEKDRFSFKKAMTFAKREKWRKETTLKDLRTALDGKELTKVRELDDVVGVFPNRHVFVSLKISVSEMKRNKSDEIL